MTDSLDGMLDDDLDELLDGTTGVSSGPDEPTEIPDTPPGGNAGSDADSASPGPDLEDETARDQTVPDDRAEVRIDPRPVEEGGYDAAQYDVLLDHGDDRAVLVEPGSAYGDERYQVLGEEPDLEPDEYDEPVGVEPEYPSTLARAGASVTAGTISAGFMTAESGLEAFYNGLRGLVGLMD